MTILHKRDYCIRPIAAQLNRFAKEIDVHWDICLNEPSTDVLNKVVSVQEAKLNPGFTLNIGEAPFSPLGNKERFMELRQWELERLPDTTHGVIIDDDHLLADEAEALRVLHTNVDLIYATKLFFWDDDAHFTTHIPEHRSVFFFRRLVGDRYPLDRTIHAPARIHDTGTSVDLKGPLLDYGYMPRADRERCWRDYKRAGKIDAATLAIIAEPTLYPWAGPYPLRTDTLK